jgi:hypothetical protein
MTQAPRPPAGGGAGLPALRAFRGAGFTLQIPADWVDMTLYTLLGPPEGDFPHWVRISVDREAGEATAEEYGEPRVRQAVQTLPGGRLLRRAPVKLSCGLPASAAEARWFPSDELRLYHRMLFVVHQGTAYTLVTQLTKKSRATVGPALGRAMLSLRPLDGRTPPPPPAAGSARFLADAFALDHPPAWSDETVYMLAEPDEGRFRRNLVVQRVVMPEAPESIEDQAWAEAEAMKVTVPDLEVAGRGAASVKDGLAAARLLLLRPAGRGRVAQRQLFAHRDGVLHVLTLTCEERPPEPVAKLLDAVLVSFAASPAAAGPGPQPGGPRPR